MPSILDLVEILKRPDGKTLDFKRDVSSADAALENEASPLGVTKPRNHLIGRAFHALRVTIATSGIGPTVVEDTARATLEALGGSNGLATSEITATIGLSPRATRTRLAPLVDRGLVREIGTGPQDPRRRYFLAERRPA